MGEFVTVTNAVDLEDGGLAAFEVRGNRIALASAAGTLYAFDDTCTHRGCSLAEGELEGTIVTCPCHGGQFDVTTGAVLAGPPPEPVRTYEVRLKDDLLLQIEI